MTRKHFIALAEALRNVRPINSKGHPVKERWRRCVEAVANVCQANNDKFDHSKFIEM